MKRGQVITGGGRTHLVNSYVGVAPGTVTLGDDGARIMLLQAVEVLEAFRAEIAPWAAAMPTKGLLDVRYCADCPSCAESGLAIVGCPAADISAPEENHSTVQGSTDPASDQVGVWWPTLEMVNVEHAWTVCHDQLALLDPGFVWPRNTVGAIDLSSFLGEMVQQLDAVIPEVRHFTGASPTPLLTYLLIGAGVVAAGGLIWALARRQRTRSPAMAGAADDGRLAQRIQAVKNELDLTATEVDRRLDELEDFGERLEERIGALEDRS